MIDRDEYSEAIDDLMDCDCIAPVEFVSNYIFENERGDPAFGAFLICTGCRKMIRISGAITKVDDLILQAENRIEIEEMK